MNNTSTQTDWQRLATLSDDEIDTSDIAELDETFFNQAKLRQLPQETLKLQLDSDVVEWLIQQSQYQSKINQLLRSYMQSKQPSRSG
jgi:uncharacterized protein (DUF4415 family)